MNYHMEASICDCNPMVHRVCALQPGRRPPSLGADKPWVAASMQGGAPVRSLSWYYRWYIACEWDYKNGGDTTLWYPHDNFINHDIHCLNHAKPQSLMLKAPLFHVFPPGPWVPLAGPTQICQQLLRHFWVLEKTPRDGGGVWCSWK